MSKPKIMVMGYARHGKDTVSEMLRDTFGYSFVSSSFFCAERILYPKLKDKYGYATPEDCFEDRSNHRAEWYDAIRAFNHPDPTALGRAILQNHDVYCGIRHHSEFQALRNSKAFDLAIWVDASDRVPKEDRSSCSVEQWMADFTLDNNGNEADLFYNLKSLHEHRILPLEALCA